MKLSKPSPHVLERVEAVEVKYIPEYLGFRYMITVDTGETYYLFVEDGRIAKQMNPEIWKKNV